MTRVIATPSYSRAFKVVNHINTRVPAPTTRITQAVTGVCVVGPEYREIKPMRVIKPANWIKSRPRIRLCFCLMVSQKHDSCHRESGKRPRPQIVDSKGRESRMGLPQSCGKKSAKVDRQFDLRHGLLMRTSMSPRSGLASLAKAA